jgi:hypothetical protein
MIHFELFAHPSSSKDTNSECSSSSNAVVIYMPGQDYVMFNGFKIQLDRVLHTANENWIGCVFCQNNRINFIECPGKSGGGGEVIVHSAEIVSSSSSSSSVESSAAVVCRAPSSSSSSGSAMVKKKDEEEECDYDDNSKKKKKVSSMRVRQAAVMLKAAKRASESVGEVLRLLKSFDHEAEVEGKLGFVDCLRERRGSVVSLHAMERTLQMVEDESVEIIHEELDIPPLKRLRH